MKQCPRVFTKWLLKGPSPSALRTAWTISCSGRRPPSRCSLQLSFKTRDTSPGFVLSITLKTRVPLLHVASAPTSNKTLET